MTPLSVSPSSDEYDELNELAQTIAALKNAHMYPYSGALSSLDSLEISAAIHDTEELMDEYMQRVALGRV